MAKSNMAGFMAKFSMAGFLEVPSRAGFSTKSSSFTGCYKPCKYRKYRLVGHPKSERRPDDLESPRNFGLRAFTHYTTVGRKMLFEM